MFSKGLEAAIAPRSETVDFLKRRVYSNKVWKEGNLGQ